MVAPKLSRLFSQRMWFAESIIKREVEHQLADVEEDARQPDLADTLCTQALLSAESSRYETPKHAAFMAVFRHQIDEIWKRIEQSTNVAKDESSWWPEYKKYVSQHIHSLHIFRESTYDQYVDKLHESGRLDSYDKWLHRQNIEHLENARATETRRQRENNARQLLRCAFEEQTGRDAKSYSAMHGADSRLAESGLDASEIEVFVVEEPRSEQQKVYEHCQTYQCWGACDICQNPEDHWHFETVHVPGKYDFRVKEPSTVGK